MKSKPYTPKDIPLWTVRLTHDFRSILAWGLENFEPQGTDAEMECVMTAAIRDKAESVMLHAGQVDYLDRLGCAALASPDAVRIDAGRFLSNLPNTRTKKPDAITATPKDETQKQRTMFD